MEGRPSSYSADKDGSAGKVTVENLMNLSLTPVTQVGNSSITLSSDPHTCSVTHALPSK